MQNLEDIFVLVFSILTVISQIGIVSLLLLFIFRKVQPSDKSSKKLSDFLSDNYIVLTFLVAAGATLGSFVMSDILGFLPCKLCWYQRIFMFPQVIIAGIALFTNDIRVKKYLVGLSIVGIGVAAYHLVLQAMPSVIQCGDQLVSCEDNPFVTFGYITIPVMSLTAFLMVLVLSIFRKEN